MKSFTAYEKELPKNFGDRLNKSESIDDVRREFKIVVLKLLNNIFPENDFDISRIIVNYENAEFKLSEELFENNAFMEIWKGSDLSEIIQRFLKEASHRYIHIKKNPEKTKLKIKNH